MEYLQHANFGIGVLDVLVIVFGVFVDSSDSFARKLPRPATSALMTNANNFAVSSVIPKGFRLKAQGCEESSTLGLMRPTSTTLKGLRQMRAAKVTIRCHEML